MYNFASMRELEWNFSEHFEIPLFNNFMEAFVDANYRLEFYKRNYVAEIVVSSAQSTQFILSKLYVRDTLSTHFA